VSQLHFSTLAYFFYQVCHWFIHRKN